MGSRQNKRSLRMGGRLTRLNEGSLGGTRSASRPAGLSVPVRRHLLGVILGLGLATAGAAEESLRFERLTVQDGAQAGIITRIIQDSRGFLWIGSHSAGLSRYDGYDFKIYEAGDAPTSLSDNSVTVLLEDSHEKDLWVGTVQGLNRWQRDEDRFVRYLHDPQDPSSLGSDFVWSLAEDATGRLWVGTHHDLNRMDRETGSFTRFPLGFEVYKILPDAGGLWLATPRGLGYFEHASEEISWHRHDPADPQSLSEDGVEIIAPAADGRIWVLLTAAGIDLFDPRTGRVERRYGAENHPLLRDSKIHSLRETRDGSLWLPSRNAGLLRIDPDGNLIRYCHLPGDPTSLNSNDVRYVFEDRTGITWISTSNGIAKLVPSQMKIETYPETGPAYALLEGRDDGLWIGTQSGPMRFDAAGRIVRLDASGEDSVELSGLHTRSLCETRDGTMWLGTFGIGLIRFDPESKEVSRYRVHDDLTVGEADDYIHALLEDRDGRFWVGTAGGLHILDRDRFTFEPGILGAKALTEFWITAIHEATDGTLWFGTRREGLYEYDPRSRKVVHHIHDDEDPTSLSGDDIRALFESHDGTLWIGTASNGLNRLDPGRGFRHYAALDGLPSNDIKSITEDADGKLWLSTSHGLSQFDLTTERFADQDVVVGSEDPSFVSRCALTRAGGELFFCTLSGLISLRPSSTETSPAPPIVLTNFKLFNVSVQPAGLEDDSPLDVHITESRKIELEHREKVITFEFAALDYTDPQNNRYSYRLEGFDEEWISTPATKRTAHYTNLDPGDYTFRVRGSNNQGVRNDVGVEVSVHVAPPPWKTKWAITLYVIAVLAALGSWSRFQHKKVKAERKINARLQELHRMKDEFLASTSHELRTPLYGMIGIAESLIDGLVGELSESAKRNLGVIVASGHRLGRLVDDILDMSKIRNHSLELRRGPVDLHGVTEVVLHICEHLVGEKEIELRNNVSVDLPPAHADESRLEQILNNLVGNAVKFTEKGYVEVSAETRIDADAGTRLVVNVSDTGIGIPDDKQHAIFEAYHQLEASTERRFGGTGLGLAITRDLVELHGGTLWLESTPGTGSSFFFSLPLSSGTATASTRPLADALEAADREPIPEEEIPPPDDWRILIVDDEPLNRRILVNHMHAHRHRTTEAADGGAALELLENDEFDLVILDVMMPKISGYEVCRRIRQRYSALELPVIFLTAKTRSSDLISGFESGGNDYVTKPVAKDELLARVDAQLGLLDAHRALKRAQAQREEVEAQLRQAHKMEAVGNLAGSIAHDFNNLLTVVLGNASILQRRLGGGSAELKSIEMAGQSGKALTGQLLSFTRQGVLQPQVVDLNAVIVQMKSLLRGVLNENIRLEINLGKDLWPIRADVGQLQQILINLSVNARDAMPRGGRLLIETANADLEAGLYTLLTVSDDGPGIDASTREKIFEPFFTTKAEGKGTGLGLATVQAIVEENEGLIELESKLGQGSSFKIYLPRSEGTVEPIFTASSAEIPGGNETVLLVEDDDEVRQLNVRILDDAGYQILSTGRVTEAIRLCETHRTKIRLLISDIVMPEMNGPSLAQRVAPLLGDAPVIFISGYTPAAIIHQGIVPGTEYLQKPFEPEVLLRRVRECLDTATARASRTDLKALRPVESGEKGTLLIVDDEDATRKVTAQILEQTGYGVLQASGGEEAIQIFRSEKDRINLVMLDSNMPGMDGLAVHEVLADESPEMKFVFCTGYGRGHFSEGFFDHERRRLLAKPFNSENLIDCIDAFMGS